MKNKLVIIPILFSSLTFLLLATNPTYPTYTFTQTWNDSGVNGNHRYLGLFQDGPDLYRMRQLSAIEKLDPSTNTWIADPHSPKTMDEYDSVWKIIKDENTYYALTGSDGLGDNNYQLWISHDNLATWTKYIFPKAPESKTTIQHLFITNNHHYISEIDVADGTGQPDKTLTGFYYAVDNSWNWTKIPNTIGIKIGSNIVETATNQIYFNNEVAYGQEAYDGEILTLPDDGTINNITKVANPTTGQKLDVRYWSTMFADSQNNIWITNGGGPGLGLFEIAASNPTQLIYVNSHITTFTLGAIWETSDHTLWFGGAESPILQISRDNGQSTKDITIDTTIDKYVMNQPIQLANGDYLIPCNLWIWTLHINQPSPFIPSTLIPWLTRNPWIWAIIGWIIILFLAISIYLYRKHFVKESHA